MSNQNQIIQVILNSFTTIFKNHHLNGLPFDWDFDPMQEVSAFFNATSLGAYDSFTFELDNQKLVFYGTYGDEEADEHITDDIHIISKGFCFYLDHHFYCFDMNQFGKVIRFFKTKEAFNGDPEFFVRKRSFYHYRPRKELSMQGFDAAFSLTEHVEARNWTSGPRTQFTLEAFSLV